MTDQELEKLGARWAEMNEVIELTLDELALLRKQDGHRVSEKQREKMREYWKANAKLLEFLVTVKMAHGVYLDPPPVSVFMRLGRLCEELGSGIVSDQIEIARLSGGGRPMARWEREAISRAIFFLEDCATGKIECSAPTAVVARHFNVTKQTVRNWRRRSGEICDGISRPHPRFIEGSMQDAGKRYTIRGRGAPSD